MCMSEGLGNIQGHSHPVKTLPLVPWMGAGPLIADLHDSICWHGCAKKSAQGMI